MVADVAGEFDGIGQATRAQPWIGIGWPGRGVKNSARHSNSIYAMSQYLWPLAFAYGTPATSVFLSSRVLEFTHFKTGSLTVTTVPLPNLLSTLIFPPCKSTQRFTITRPRPVPGRSSTLCPRWNALKSHSRSASGIPILGRGWRKQSLRRRALFRLPPDFRRSNTSRHS